MSELEDWNPNDPDTVNVYYDLSEWSIDHQAELSEALAENEIPHAWADNELIVPEALEEQLDELFAVLEARLGIASADAPTPQPVGLDADEPATEYDLGDWSDRDRVLVAEGLVASRIPHRWEGTLLVVPVDAEDAVDELLDDIEQGQVWAVPSEDDEADSDDPVDAVDEFGVLSTLFDAGDRLARNLFDPHGLQALRESLDVLDDDDPLPGVDAAAWRVICATADELAAALVDGDRPDEPAAIDAAERLREQVRPFV
jgi:hypothetical protein